MYFPQFLVGMSATATVVAIWAYVETGSVWAALGWTILALVILQVGYVGLVIRLVFRRSSEATDARSAAVDPTQPLVFWPF
jgi:exopolysaccharide production regulatory protein